MIEPRVLGFRIADFGINLIEYLIGDT